MELLLLCLFFKVILFNKLFSTGVYPSQWTEAIIQPLHKKGDKNSRDNYRGISLLNVCSKLYSHILSQRLNRWIDENDVINESQAGFRKKYSTLDHVFTLFALVQKQLLYHKKLYVAFIDFRKAFDSVVRVNLWHVLKKRGIHGKMYNAITSIYHVVKARVRAGGELSDAFMCPLGLKQGEVCSPVLFSLFINELASEIISKGKHGVQLIPDLFEILILMFADDVVLISDSITGLQKQLNVLYETALSLGLVVNLEKSNIIVFRNGGYLSLNEKWFYGRTKMNVVNMYKYLGVILSTKLSFSHMLCDIANKGKRGVINIFKLLKRIRERSPKVFFKMFDAQIQPILSYGAEVWGLIANLDAIEKVHTFALKRFLNVSIRTPNVLVYGEMGRFPLYINMYIRSIKYWLRILKMPEHRLPLKAYKMLLFLHRQNRNTWASSVCSFLYKHGFQEVWENQGVGNEYDFFKLLRNRLIEGFREQ